MRNSLLVFLLVSFGIASRPEIASSQCPVDYSTGTVTAIGSFSNSSSTDLAIWGNYAFLAGFGLGVQIVDISNPVAPTLVGNIGGGNAVMVAASGSTLYVMYDDALRVFNVSNPAAPVFTGIVALPSSLAIAQAGMTISGSFVFVPDYTAGLQIVDVSHPAHPTVVGGVAIPSFPVYHVAVSGSYAYVTGWTEIRQPFPNPEIQVSGLRIINISNPSAPFLVGSLDTQTRMEGLSVSQNLAYVADNLSGFEVVDVSNPASPFITGSLNIGASFDAAVFGNYAYVASWYLGLRVLDVSNAQSPVLLGVASGAGFAFRVSLAGSSVFVCDDGVIIYPTQCLDFVPPPPPPQNQPPDCSGAFAPVAPLWPPDHKMSPVTIEGVVDPEGGPVKIAITSITQDEPVDQGGYCPDAQILTDGSALVRRERQRNGRVYRLSFTATDMDGASCEGTVRVCVPPSRSNLTCFEDALVFDSLGPCTQSLGTQASEKTEIGNIDQRGPWMSVAYTTTAEAQVRLELFDVAGRRVSVLLNETQGTGAHSTQWNVSNLSKGLYFLRMTSGDAQEVRRTFIR
jgi:hypothetical protein